MGGEASRELTFQTNNGKRAFAPGDRIIFLENNRDLASKTACLARSSMWSRARSSPGSMVGSGDSVSIPTGSYRAIDHGYATTIHKNQGRPVDRAFVLASTPWIGI